MPTRFYMRANLPAPNLAVGGAAFYAASERMGGSSSTTDGSEVALAQTNTVASGTNIQWVSGAGSLTQWYSNPVVEAITISGTITVNIRGLESANNVNAGRGIFIQRTDSVGTVQSTILADTTVPTVITEFTTTDAANGTATYTPTSTAMSVGDRILIIIKVRNVGTMGAGSITGSFNGSTSGVRGDTWVQFNENIRTDNLGDTKTYEIIQQGYYG